MKKHKKPTTAFGAISFSNKGEVSKQITKLSEYKQIQESEVMNIFREQYNQQAPDRQISQITPLPENDQDFAVTIHNSEILVQLTELVTREYYIKLSKQDYNSGKLSNSTTTEDKGISYSIDKRKMTFALQKLIQKKVDKNYSKGKQAMWLVVFTTDAGYLREYIENGQRKVSDSLIIARECVSKLREASFSEIWFTNLQTRPIKI